MSIATRGGIVALVAGAGLVALASGNASAAIYTIDWLDLNPISSGGFVATPQTFNLPGYGSVEMVITSPFFGHNRSDAAQFQNGSVNPGGDTYSWGPFASPLGVNTNNPAPFSVDFNFLSGPVPAGRLAFGAWGLGRIDLVVPTDISTFTVDKNGTFLGDYDSFNAYAPSEFIPGAGTFTMRNSLPGDLTPGNPAFNTKLGVVRIDDALTTLHMDGFQINNDGAGFTVGWIDVPSPGAASLIVLGGLLAARRRR